MTNAEKFKEVFHSTYLSHVPVFTQDTLAWLESEYQEDINDNIQHVGYDDAACGYEK